MNKKRKILTAIAGVTSLTLLGVVAINLNAPSALYRSNAESHSFTFDAALAKQYWGYQDYSVKSIARTSNPDNNIKAKANGNSYGGGNNFCESRDNMVNKSLSVIAGVNNLQSFTFNYHVHFTTSNTFRSEITVKFYGLQFDFDRPDNPASSPTLFTKTYEESSLEDDHVYTITWNKTTENKTVRYVQFYTKLYGDNTSDYLVLFVNNFSLTWSC